MIREIISFGLLLILVIGLLYFIWNPQAAISMIDGLAQIGYATFKALSSIILGFMARGVMI